jgi:nucleotide-binding universal stress UspA family protein
MARILVPVDGSAGSDKAVRFAISLLGEKDKEIILMNVQYNYNTLNIKRFISQKEIRSYQEGLSNEVFDHTLKITNNSFSRARTIVRIGDPGREICAEAKKGYVDFIVMGCKRQAAVKRVILGSVATHVFHATTCPLMIVP